ncbi:MAG: ribosome maturation factor RimP [Bdellovibrionota bacterium]
MTDQEKAEALAEVYQREKQLLELIFPLIEPMGYRLISLEAHAGQGSVLRLYIERLDATAVGIEDCVAVSRALDEPLDLLPLMETIFNGPYELEVSSPGLDRPIRAEDDFERFAGKPVRIGTLRPLLPDESSNPQYVERNPKQKNFIGRLGGLREGRVVLEVDRETILIPMGLITRARLDSEAEARQSDANARRSGGSNRRVRK